MTALVWSIESPYVTLNSTVYYTLNTSGRSPRGNQNRIAPLRRGRVAVQIAFMCGLIA
jgi:hypothetical protein